MDASDVSFVLHVRVCSELSLARAFQSRAETFPQTSHDAARKAGVSSSEVMEVWASSGSVVESDMAVSVHLHTYSKQARSQKGSQALWQVSSWLPTNKGSSNSGELSWKRPIAKMKSSTGKRNEIGAARIPPIKPKNKLKYGSARDMTAQRLINAMPHVACTIRAWMLALSSEPGDTHATRNRVTTTVFTRKTMATCTSRSP
mmetsp:Transcript_90587/g.255760  ORF Transcript_90587/g.255760 Transcript_90587/m.255760 type:complete len:202 (+) Transcript_90587:466-1071(+)